MKTETTFTMTMSQFKDIVTTALKTELKHVQFNRVEINIINKDMAVIHYIQEPETNA